MYKWVERWEIFHDGFHNYDAYGPGQYPGNNGPYYLEHCDYCKRVKIKEITQFYGQGGVYIETCNCLTNKVDLGAGI